MKCESICCIKNNNLIRLNSPGDSPCQCYLLIALASILCLFMLWTNENYLFSIFSRRNNFSTFKIPALVIGGVAITPCHLFARLEDRKKGVTCYRSNMVHANVQCLRTRRC